MKNLTLKEIPLEDAMNSGDTVLAQWDEYDIHNEVGWDIACYNALKDVWVRSEDWDCEFARCPSRVFELPGGVE